MITIRGQGRLIALEVLSDQPDAAERRFHPGMFVRQSDPPEYGQGLIVGLESIAVVSPPLVSIAHVCVCDGHLDVSFFQFSILFFGEDC